MFDDVMLSYTCFWCCKIVVCCLTRREKERVATLEVRDGRSLHCGFSTSGGLHLFSSSFYSHVLFDLSTQDHLLKQAQPRRSFSARPFSSSLVDWIVRLASLEVKPLLRFSLLQSSA